MFLISPYGTSRFNPCFNGTMYKNAFAMCRWKVSCIRFNPCFNGTMYKNDVWKWGNAYRVNVSILVLMELCIKTMKRKLPSGEIESFNPCFNGTMYKNQANRWDWTQLRRVSILVLMELCIKTLFQASFPFHFRGVSILVLMELCIKTEIRTHWRGQGMEVSILVLMELCIKTLFIILVGESLNLFQSLF